MSNRWMPDTLRFLTELGFDMYIDLDQVLQIDYPEGLTAHQIAMRLGAEYRDELAVAVRHRAMLERHQFIGGPFNGEPHRLSNAFSPLVSMRVSRANWAAYFLVDDGRAFFQGMATSEKKARQLAWQRGGPIHGKHFKMDQSP